MSDIPEVAERGFYSFLAEYKDALAGALSVCHLVDRWLPSGGYLDCAESFEVFLITLLRIQHTWMLAKMTGQPTQPIPDSVSSFAVDDAEFRQITDPFQFRYACVNH